jgi:hypothetical protein
MWEDVDIAAGQINVSRSWDISEAQDVGPKSAVGRRKVPIASRLRALLAAYRLPSPRVTGRMLGTTGTGVGRSPSARTRLAARPGRERISRTRRGTPMRR